jgi:hypothetical protein
MEHIQEIEDFLNEAKVNTKSFLIDFKHDFGIIASWIKKEGDEDSNAMEAIVNLSLDFDTNDSQNGSYLNLLDDGLKVGKLTPKILKQVEKEFESNVKDALTYVKNNKEEDFETSDLVGNFLMNTYVGYSYNSKYADILSSEVESRL